MARNILKLSSLLLASCILCLHFWVRCSHWKRSRV